MALSDDDYDTLDEFIKAVIQKVASHTISEVDGVATIMHPLTAWNNGNHQEFIPWIKSWLEESDA